jgi:hypothetical protein
VSERSDEEDRLKAEALSSAERLNLSGFKTLVDDYIGTDPVLSGMAEPTFANISNSAEDLYNLSGLGERFGPNALRYASEKLQEELSNPTLDATQDMGWIDKNFARALSTPEVLATLGLEGTSGLNPAHKTAWNIASYFVNKSAKKEAEKYGYELDKDVMPATTFGLRDIIQGGYENAAGDPIPIPRPNFTVSTGTGETITPTYIGLLNNQGASGGQVSAWGGQPRHHIAGLLGVLENLTGNNLTDIGTVVSRIMENRSGGDIENVKQAARDVDKDKFAGLYT